MGIFNWIEEQIRAVLNNAFKTDVTRNLGDVWLAVSSVSMFSKSLLIVPTFFYRNFERASNNSYKEVQKNVNK